MKNNKVKQVKPQPKSEVYTKLSDIVLQHSDNYKIKNFERMLTTIETYIKELVPLDKQFQVLDFDTDYIISKAKNEDYIKLGYVLYIVKDKESEKVMVNIYHHDNEILTKTFINNNFAHKWINHNFGLMRKKSLESYEVRLLNIVNNLTDENRRIRLMYELTLEHKGNHIICKYYDGDEIEGEDKIKIFYTLESYFKYMGELSMECVKQKLVELSKITQNKLSIWDKIQS